MAKSHISIWLTNEKIKECDANMKITNCKSRSEYIEKAVEFYNGYLHDQNNEIYICNAVNSTISGMLNSFEKRMARMMFKQAVETSKLFWLCVKGFNYEPEDVDDLHYDCIEEVKRINGAINFPFNGKDSDE